VGRDLLKMLPPHPKSER